jgi:GYF domain 2
MADQWYYAIDQERLGPFSSAQLKELATIGQLIPTHIVWKEGVDKGVLAAKVKNLFPAVPGESPPPDKEKGVGVRGEESEDESPSPKSLTSETDRSVPALVNESPPPRSPPSVENQGPALQTDPVEEQKLQRKQAPKQIQPPAKRLFRIVGSSGAVVLGHDGTYVRYKKKCPKCGYEDSSMKTMAIRSGVNRDRFFCQKCRKLQQVEIHGAV